MANSSGQDWALRQLELIEKASEGRISHGTITEPIAPDGDLKIVLSVLCADFETLPDGLPLNQREEVEVVIPSDFPYSVPEARSRHRRFQGFTHVQWGNYLCLYQARAVEWNPADGMFGFVERILDFFESGAKNQLDPTGAPIHPPVAYGYSTRNLIPSVNVPALREGIWCGFAEIQKVNDSTYEIIHWSEDLDIDTSRKIAPVFLFEEKLPAEFPDTLDKLIKCIEFPDALVSLLLAMLRIASSYNRDSTPLMMIIGTPMRGVVGDQETKIHIAAWEITDDIKTRIALSLQERITKAEVETVAENTDEEIKTLIRSSRLNWVNIFENRPEIVVSRTSASIFSVLKDKNIFLIGAGAIGSMVGELLIREGVASLGIIDDKQVKPGIICRQNYLASDIGTNKAIALRQRLSAINPKIQIKAFSQDLIDALGASAVDLKSYDLVIDASASNIVSSLLSSEPYSQALPDVFSVVINANASLALLAFKPRNSGLAVNDLFRSAKIKCHREDGLREVLNSFWPKERTGFFQPEPGCSEPTFHGSYSDIALLTNAIFRSAVEAKGVRPFFQHTSIIDGRVQTFTEYINSQAGFKEENIGYQIHLSGFAETQYRQHIRNAMKRRGKELETGGLLFGSVDTLNKRIHVDYISDAPTDSVFRKDSFVCGTTGIPKLQQAIKAQFGDSVEFIGTWHTHPYSEARPSEIDKAAAQKLLGNTRYFVKRVLIMIVSYDDRSMTPRFFQYEDFGE